MDFNIKEWKRFEWEDISIYFHKNEADWFVPNKMGDDILRGMAGGRDYESFISQRFIKRLPQEISRPYSGRSEHLSGNELKEIWFHLTNRCNLSCTHCLFSSSPKETDELNAEKLLKIAAEGHDMGCRVFALTGGEPLIHDEIKQIVDGLLHLDNSHVVILTNGMNIIEMMPGSSYDPGRFHLQISVDGLGERHDMIRGKGTFEKLNKNLKWLKKNRIPFTLSMSVNSENIADMPGIIDFAVSSGAANVHFMWYFIRGRGKSDWFTPAEDIYPYLVKSAEKAEKACISIDNIEALKTQIFTPRGTIHDGTTSGWESLAVGPDAMIYPSPALVGQSELVSEMSGGLGACLTNSPVLEKIRSCTIADLNSDLRFFTGGGDMDHSYARKKTFMGDDPYEPLYRKMMMWLIAREASGSPENNFPAMRLRMGERLESCGAHGRVALIHSNCLLAAAGENSITTVKSFYTEAADKKNRDILNPVSYDNELMNHIPEEFRFRGYGCGSPVLDADIKEGEIVVDLGSGRGIECFIAAKITGGSGNIVGIDMLDPMLKQANKALKSIEQNLGYKNITFKKGYLEDIPLKDNSVDVVISNCVMNLSVNKRKAYSEILRILRPGGRLVISDVVCETEPDPVIRNDETLRGECIAGALTQSNLMGLLEETGFEGILLNKRFPYRNVMNHPFYSLTYTAKKPDPGNNIKTIYRGPASGILLKDGTVLLPGHRAEVPESYAEIFNEQIFLPDESGNIINIEAENACDCCTVPENNMSEGTLLQDLRLTPPKQKSGCMVCGEALTYFTSEKDHECAYCGKIFSVNALCKKGHYVCDACHGKDGFQVIENICMNSPETDMVKLLEKIRSHPSIPIHGPEHHAMVPAIIVTTYINLGGNVPRSAISTAIKRGGSVAGGHCGFMGACGGALGAGTALSILLDGNPLKGDVRQLSQTVTKEVLTEIIKYDGARCCQRDSWIALKKMAELSEKYLPITLKANHELKCNQKKFNKDCLGKKCPLF